MSLFGLLGCSSAVDDLKKLGDQPFTEESWSSATKEARAEMVYSFVTERDLEKLTAEDIIRLLGEPNAYYEYDEFPAYLVGPDSIQSEYGEGYLLAFPVDRETGFVKKFVLQPKP